MAKNKSIVRANSESKISYTDSYNNYLKEQTLIRLEFLEKLGIYLPDKEDFHSDSPKTEKGGEKTWQ